MCVPTRHPSVPNPHVCVHTAHPSVSKAHPSVSQGSCKCVAPNPKPEGRIRTQG
ncbi:hypothetical protein T484DRAFT_1936514 [Baffinella frigidus]|nr:hypothetical protein T484DRAFT_1936514 [Cryptophyta sp. CCMP2293]